MIHGQLVQWFMESLIHWFNDWFTGHWFTGSLIHGFAGSLIRWLLNSLIHCFIDSLVHWFIQPAVHGISHVISLASQQPFAHSLMHLTTSTLVASASQKLSYRPIGHLLRIIVVSLLRNFRPGTCRALPGISSHSLFLDYRQELLCALFLMEMSMLFHRMGCRQGLQLPLQLDLHAVEGRLTSSDK